MYIDRHTDILFDVYQCTSYKIVYNTMHIIQVIQKNRTKNKGNTLGGKGDFLKREQNKTHRCLDYLLKKVFKKEIDKAQQKSYLD